MTLSKYQIKERPITLTSGEVRAVLEGRKAQHRVLIENVERIKITDYSNNTVEQSAISAIFFKEVNGKLAGFYGGPFSVKRVVKDFVRDFCPYSVGDHITLNDELIVEVADIRVERVRDITDRELLKNGCPPNTPSIDSVSITHGFREFSQSYFAQKWISKYGQKSWDNNDWVWVIDFKVVEGA